jgi:hypothetical protein
MSHFDWHVITPKKKKNKKIETLEAPQNKTFYVKM